MILSPDEQIEEYTRKGWWGTETEWDLFLKNAEANPGRIALVDPPNRSEFTTGQPLCLSYADVREAANRLAAGMLELGLRKDDIVMAQLPNIAELVLLYLAAAQLGVIVSPLAVQYRTHELRQTMTLTQPKAFITTTQFGGFNYVDMVRGLQPEFPSLKTIIALGDNLPEGVVSLTALLNTPHDQALLQKYLAETSITANDCLAICWTSGTEAESKGVPRSHNHWIAIGWASVDGCEFEPGYNLLNPFPLINMAAVGGMFTTWNLTGGKLVLHQPLSLPVFLQQIKTEKINYTVVPPALLNMLLQNQALMASIDFSTLKNIGSGGGPLSAWMVSQWQERGINIINIFGSNEGASFTSGPKEMPDPVRRAQYFPRFGVPGFKWASRVSEYMSTKLVDPATKEVITEPGVPGEMAIKGACIFNGYYKRPDLTAKAFDKDGYFYTGDLFEIAGEEGNLDSYRFVGRVKDIIIRGGVNISSEEIENLLQGHPRVAEVAVVGYPDDRLGEKVCAVVAPKKDQTLTLDDVTSFLKEKDIAIFKLPEKVVVVDALPRNPVGKILKRSLREQVRAAGE